LEAGSAQVLFHLRKLEYMKAVVPATPLPDAAKLQDATATYAEIKTERMAQAS
jgi:hypothetical protein